ncbi:MAG: flagellar motor switch protein FliG [bacterium]
MSEENEKVELSGASQAAVLLLTVGEEAAANVLKHLGPKEVQRVGSAMAEMDSISKPMVNHTIKSFALEIGDHTALGTDADSYIRNVLVDALGEGKASGLIDRILMGRNSKGLEALKWMDAKGISEIIRNEHPQIQSIILSYLDADLSASVLSELPENVRADIIMRIATLEGVQPDALKELDAMLEQQFANGGGSGKMAGIGGLENAANILNFLDSTTEQALMENVKESDEQLAESIEDLMFVFDNLMEVDDRSIQTLLREISTETLIPALKGADDQLAEKFLKNMSKRAAEMLRDDLEVSGPIRLSDVEAAQKEILSTARKLADQGDIMLGGGGDDFV